MVCPDNINHKVTTYLAKSKYKEKFRKAIEEGNIEEIKDLIKKGKVVCI